jgi:hypothetical protein
MILEEMISYAPSWDRDLSGLLPLARGLCDLRRSRCDRPRDPPRLGVTKAAPSYGSATLFGIARRSPAVACAAPHGSLPLVDCRLRCSLLLTTPTVALDEHLQPGLKNAAIDWLTTFALRLQDLVARIQDRAGATLADLQQPRTRSSRPATRTLPCVECSRRSGRRPTALCRHRPHAGRDDGRTARQRSSKRCRSIWAPST